MKLCDQEGLGCNLNKQPPQADRIMAIMMPCLPLLSERSDSTGNRNKKIIGTTSGKPQESTAFDSTSSDYILYEAGGEVQL